MLAKTDSTAPSKAIPVATQCKIHAGHKADAESEQTDHIGCDRKLDELAADRNGDSAVHSGEDSIGGLDEPRVQFLFGGHALLRKWKRAAIWLRRPASVSTECVEAEVRIQFFETVDTGLTMSPSPALQLAKAHKFPLAGCRF